MPTLRVFAADPGELRIELPEILNLPGGDVWDGLYKSTIPVQSGELLEEGEPESLIVHPFVESKIWLNGNTAYGEVLYKLLGYLAQDQSVTDPRPGGSFRLSPLQSWYYESVAAKKRSGDHSLYFEGAEIEVEITDVQYVHITQVLLEYVEAVTSDLPTPL